MATPAYVRLKPYNKERGYVRQRFQLGVGGPVFKQGKWYFDEFEPEQLDYMRKCKQNDMDQHSPDVFDIILSKEAWEEIVREERRAKLGLNKMDPESFQEDVTDRASSPKAPDFRGIKEVDPAAVANKAQAPRPATRSSDVPEESRKAARVREIVEQNNAKRKLREGGGDLSADEVRSPKTDDPRPQSKIGRRPGKSPARP